MSTHDYHWTFGQGCHIHFPKGGDPVALPKLPTLSTNEGCATFCDGNGDLLFYTDGRSLFDSTHAVLIPLPPALSLGGSSGSAHSAIIVPPAGGGSLYHLFAVHDWDTGSTDAGPVFHTAIEASPQVKVASSTTRLPDANFKASERLAAIPHTDSGKYWVVGMEGNTNTSGSRFLAILVDSNAAPEVGKITVSLFKYAGSSGFCIKFSPDGSLLAVASKATIDFLNFDRGTGEVTDHSQITGLGDSYSVPAPAKNSNSPFGRPYGLEFSPNGKYLYFSDCYAGYVRRHTIGKSGDPPTPLASTSLIKKYDGKADDKNYPVGALQLAPNGKIYGTRPGSTSLLEITHPDDATLPANAATVGFKDFATAADGKNLVLNAVCALGLPTFTRIPEDQIDRCKEVAARVEEVLKGRRLINVMEPCEGRLEDRGCAPLWIPPLRPWVSITWGDSECDCIEGDDIEIMHLTVCNPYSNVTLSRLTVNEVAVVDERGEPVRLLPDDSPCIQLVPIGPYCFDDIAPCTCVTREFMLRLRGAPGNRKYRILVKGICFDACFHGDTEACFTFEVCKD